MTDRQTNTAQTTVTDRTVAGPQPDPSPPSGGSFASPMTTLGDMIYGIAAGQPARLGGNSTARRKFLAQTGTGSASAAPAWSNGPRFNVDDFGAVGDGVADDTAAINVARAALVAAGGGCLYFPGKAYNSTGITAITTVPVAFLGNGMMSTTLVNTHATNPIIAVTGQFAALDSLRFSCTQNRANGNPLMSFDGNGTDALIYFSRLQIRSNADAILCYRCVPHFTDCTVKVLKQGGYALWAKSAGFTAVNSLFFTGGTNQPPVWIQGTATSVAMTNVGIVGAGPRASYVPTSITSTAINFTVNFGANHSFAVGDWINISAVTPASYRGYWRIASKTATSVTITSAINPGNATIAIAATALVADQRYAIATVGSTDFTAVGAAFNTVGIPFKASGAGTGSGTASGTVYSVTCALLVDNELGSVNESQIVGSQIGASGYPKDPLSAGIYFDGRRGTGSIEGWTIADSYVDLGRVGILFTGKGTGGAVSTLRCQVDSVTFEGNAGDGDSTMLGQVWVEQCPSISLNNLKCSDASKDPTCQALYVYSDGSAPFCDGLKVDGCELGICDNWATAGAGNTATYGATFDGAINFFTFTNNVVWGQTAPVLNANSAIGATTVVKSFGNSFFTGTTWPATCVYVPYFHKCGSGTVKRSTNQTFTTGVEAAITWSGVEDSLDDAGMWAGGNPTRLTVQGGQRLLRLTATGVFDQNATGDRRWRIVDNNGKVWSRSNPDHPTNTTSGATLDTGWVDVVAEGISYFELKATQWSGGNLDAVGATQGETRMSYEMKEHVKY